MIFQTRIAGIPCQIEVTHYTPALPMRLYGAGFGDAHPPEPEEFEFVVLDRSGRPADWLAAKLRPADEARIFNEFQPTLKGDPSWS